ncbi:MAG: ABC transporter ATP-binding protein [Chloroflexota bacterium]
MLEVRELVAGYGEVRVLRGISLWVGAGEVVALVGSNGAGKTTTLRTISGLIRPVAGEVIFNGRRIDGLKPHEVVRLGVVQVPEGRKLFPTLTVLENLELGAYIPEAKRYRAQSLELVFEFFPVLAERRNQAAGTLSGGQQQMLAIARALMARPKLLMLDEPSLGLAPNVVTEIFRKVSQIREAGTTVLLVEQNVRRALKVADRGYVLENGRIVLEGSGAELLTNDHVRRAYLGI